ncbi:MAG: hypothetical protein JST45_00125 [Bacteroidetes bacterium]|nr:hypothetical protein [Bacteroidota bacterium]
MELQRRSEMAQLLRALRGHAPDGLRTVAVVGGVEYIDDSRSTFLDASLCAILDLGKPLVWIIDGSMAKALDQRMLEFMREHVDGTVFFGPADAAAVDALDAAIGGVYAAGDLRTAVFAARELACLGAKVLFSPACPSGNGTANHAERAVEFKRAVLDL